MAARLLLKKHKDVQKLPFTLGTDITNKKIISVIHVYQGNKSEVSVEYSQTSGIEILNEVTGSIKISIVQADIDKFLSTGKDKVIVVIWLYNMDDTIFARGEVEVEIEI